MMELVSSALCFDGRMQVWRHRSEATATPMRFGIFLPAATTAGPRPALYCLAGLTCTDENFPLKSGIQRLAALHGLVLVFPDTSPRDAEGDDAESGISVPDEEAIDVGKGAGFYVTATEAPWSAHYDMWRYVTRELPSLVEAQFPVVADRRGILGHSMGGHGALIAGLREPDRWASVSAISPIANPTSVDWGRRAFSRYLGPIEAAWQDWDASLLMARTPYPGTILVDQGEADPYLEALRPQSLREAADASGQSLVLRMHAGYDHSYWFVQTVLADHLAHHARALRA